MCVILCTKHTRCGHQDAQLIRCRPDRACVLPGAVARDFTNFCGITCQGEHARILVLQSFGLPEAEGFTPEVETEIENAMPSGQELLHQYRREEEMVLVNIHPQHLWECDLQRLQLLCHSFTFDHEGNVREPDESQNMVARGVSIHKAFLRIPSSLFSNLSDADRASFYNLAFGLFDVYISGILPGMFRNHFRPLDQEETAIQCLQNNFLRLWDTIRLVQLLPISPIQREELGWIEILIQGFGAQFAPRESNIHRRQRLGEPRQFVNPISRRANEEGLTWLSASKALEVARAFYLSSECRISSDDYLTIGFFDPSAFARSAEEYWMDFAAIEASGLFNIQAWMPQPEDIEAVRSISFDPADTPRELEAIVVPAEMSTWNFGPHVEEAREQAAEQARRDAAVASRRRALFDALTETLEVDGLDDPECHICHENYEEVFEDKPAETPSWFVEQFTCPICRRDYTAAFSPADNEDSDDGHSEFGSISDGDNSDFDELLIDGLERMVINDDDDELFHEVFGETNDGFLYLDGQAIAVPIPAVHEIHAGVENLSSDAEVSETANE